VFDRGWHRATRPGRQLWLYKAFAVSLAVLAAYSVIYTLRLAPEPKVIAYSLVYWVVLGWFGLLTWRCLQLGIYAGEEGIKIVWLSHQRVIAWDDIRAMLLVQSPISFGGRMFRVVVETTDGEHVPLQGTDDIMRWLFKANSPEKVRHKLERERRFYLGKQLPRRVPPARSPKSPPVIDLRDDEDGSPPAAGNGSVGQTPGVRPMRTR
jgi:hypothetical protein